MKKFFEEYLHVPQTGMLREKVMLTRITISIICVIVYMIIMTFSAYAYFSYTVETPVVTMRSSAYRLEFTAPDDVAAPIGGVYTLNNDSDEQKTFTFVVKKPNDENLASVGYCKIWVKTDVNNMADASDSQMFYTKPIGVFVENGQEITVNERYVTVVVAPKKSAVVRFTAEWGSCASVEIIDQTVTPQFLN